MDGKVIVVTGASGVLGQALVTAAREAGARVAALDLAPAPATGGDLLTLGGVDLTDPRSAGAAMDAVRAHYGGVGALMNAVGGFVWQPVADSEPAAWERMQRLNVLTVLNACRAALPALIADGEGRIVNVGAFAARQAAGGMGPYTAAKAGVHRLTEALAEETKDQGVTVNAVLPTTLDTPDNRRDMPDVDWTRWVQAGDLARVMLFLASTAAGAVTGALIPVRGRT